MKAYRITTPAFDEKSHIYHAETQGKAKWKCGSAMADAGFGHPFYCIQRYITSVKREPGLDTPD